MGVDAMQRLLRPPFFSTLSDCHPSSRSTGAGTQCPRHAAVTREPAALKIQAVVEADDRNRSLEVVAQSDGYIRSVRFNSTDATPSVSGRSEFRDVPHGKLRK